MIGCDCEVCISTDKKDKRLRSSILVQSPSTTVVVDTGPDFRYQALRAGLVKLDAVLFTHPHRDHMAGLDDVKAFNFILQKPVDIYADKLTEEALRRDYYYAFNENKYPGVPELNMHEIADEPFRIGDIPVIPIKVWHHKMPVLGFRFGKFTYITDANRIDIGEQEKITGSEVLIINALRKAKHLSHFTLSEAIGMVRDLSIPRAYLTHLSHQMGKHAAVEADLPAGIALAYDGLKLSFGE